MRKHHEPAEILNEESRAERGKWRGRGRNSTWNWDFRRRQAVRSGHARSSDESSMDVWMCTVKYNWESRLRERRGGGRAEERGGNTTKRGRTYS